MNATIEGHIIGIETDQHTIALVVTMEDEKLHTEANNFTCDDDTCPCHSNYSLDNGLSYVPEYHYTSQHNAAWLIPKDK